MHDTVLDGIGLCQVDCLGYGSGVGAENMTHTVQGTLTPTTPLRTHPFRLKRSWRAPAGPHTER